jgi:NitT/TauT family transport system ATP-binding protein
MSTPLLKLRSVNKSFKSADGSDRLILENVDFMLNEGEIVALLGQSGSGKSTLLRIMAGLISADSGQVEYAGKPIYGPVDGISMVFQSFALFPWLSVQQNVELGLEARGIAPMERAKKAKQAIELIGLEGFEGALPKELSGGMRQRVGIARAIVLEPEVLLMDEAFSALDVMTGEHLRDDILELWQSGDLPTKSILVVSHNIEEAVMMADRALIFSSNPGRVRFELPIGLERPREPKTSEIHRLVDCIYTEMVSPQRRLADGQLDYGLALERSEYPRANIASIEGLMERLIDPEFLGHADLPKIAEATEMSDNAFINAVDDVLLLEFAVVKEGDLIATELGSIFGNGDSDLRKQILGQQALQTVPFISNLFQELKSTPAKKLPFDTLTKTLGLSLDKRDVKKTLDLILEWATYGDLIDLDFKARKLFLHVDTRVSI